MLGEFNAFMDRACKYIVVATTFTVTVTSTPWDGSSCFVPIATGMSVATAIAGKVLKKLINHSRPTGARKADPGMPSSHAVALSYLSTAAALGVLWHNRWVLSPNVAVTMMFAVGMGVYWTVLRVLLGHHTVPQVLVGFVFGMCSAVTVFAVNFVGFDGPEDGGRVDHYSNTMSRQAVAGILAVLCSITMVRVGKRWIREDCSGAH